MLELLVSSPMGTYHIGDPVSGLRGIATNVNDKPPSLLPFNAADNLDHPDANYADGNNKHQLVSQITNLGGLQAC